MSTPIITRTGTINVNANNLHAAITKITRGLPATGVRKPHTIEGLSVRTIDGALTLTVLRCLETNADVIVRHELSVKADVDVDVVVPLRQFTKVVRDLKMNLKRYASCGVALTVTDNGVDLELDGLIGHVDVANEATVTQTTAMANLLATAPESTTALGSVTGHQLIESWKRTHKAVMAYGYDFGLSMLSNIKVVNADGHLTMQGTDRFRLALSSMQACGAGELDALIFPAQALNVAQLLATNDNKVLNFSADTFDGQEFVAIHTLHIDVFARVENTEFPKVEPLIPTAARYTATFDAAVMLDHLKLLKPHLDRSQQIQLYMSDGTIELRTSGDTPQERTMVATFKGYDNPEMLIAFNAGYLMDGLANRDGAVTMLINQPSRPALILDASDERITPVPDDDEAVVKLTNPTVGNTYLLMPVRLPG